MIFKSNKRKYFTKNKAIDLMVYLSATGANSEKRWRGLQNSLEERFAGSLGPILEKLKT